LQSYKQTLLLSELRYFKMYFCCFHYL